MFARGVIVLLCVLVAVSDGAREPDCKPYSGYACPKNYDPVCGSDGITYANECMLCLANMISNTTIIIEKEGECDRPLEPDCKPNPSNLCTWIYRPVCGSDGKTYGNECMLCVAIKESNTTILIVKQGKCDQLIQPDCKLYSSNICPLIYDPVCGSDGKTYGNECMFCAANQTSNTAILIVKEGECDRPHQPNCKPYSSKGCPKIYRPVCGSDGKTYGNVCELCAAIKESNTTILIQKPGECDRPQQPDCKPYSGYVCTPNIAPVCGSDGKTYGHECDLCAANLTSNTAILIVKQGECDQPQQPNCKPNPSKICLMIYDPVCGSDGKTYGNECELCIAIEESNTTILIVKQGECDQLIQPNCKPYLPNMCLIYKPVCGSDEKTYGNECRFCVANEISNNTILIQKEGECDRPLQPDCKPYSGYVCTLNIAPVCGSDGKTYGHECDLCAANLTSNTAILIVKQGECDRPLQPNCKPNPSKICLMIYDPVCGSDGKTYGNECELCIAIEESNTTILIVKQGECDQLIQPNCKPYLPNMCLIYKPVCGSDEKTYGNECRFCVANEISNNTILIQKEGECDRPLQV